MMKKCHKLILISFMCLAIAGLIIGIRSKHTKHMQLQQSLQHIPDFTFYTAEELPYGSGNLNRRKITYIFHYDIECEHCLMQIEEIKKSMISFEDINLLMVSANQPSSVKQFITDHSELFIDSQIFLFDTEHRFSSFFGNAATPAIYIYNNDQELLKAYHGLVLAEKLLEYAK